MIDPTTYNEAEARGFRSISNWVWQSMMTTSALEPSSFPMRIQSVRDLRPLLDSMHQSRFAKFVAELKGVSEQEIDEIVAGIARFARFYVRTFHDGTVPLPMNTMLSSYLVSRKLRALPQRGSMLEIGPGAGYLAFFTGAEHGFATRTQIEVTQSLYLMQALVNGLLFEERYQDLAVTDENAAALGTLTDGMRIRNSAYEQTPTLHWRPDPAMVQVPWWRIDDALNGSTTYDVIVANANLYEMTFGAFAYYFENFRHCLAPHGAVLLQDLGLRRGHETLNRMDTLISLGYRPLVNVAASKDKL
ncbi:MAG: hypothetical protein P1U88_10220, partial [Thalassobaculaceae bacterium]|nr:hypothetical protein [Thalassobaculaceae bacterium]